MVYVGLVIPVYDCRREGENFGIRINYLYKYSVLLIVAELWRM